MLLPHMVVKGKVGSIPVQIYCLSLHIKSIEIACGISDVWAGGRVHVLAVLKMVRADLVRVVQLLCSFRAKITWPSVYDPFLGPVKGRCWSKNCFAHFSIHSFHFTFIMISIKNMEKKKLFFSRASFPWKWRASLILGHSPRYI